jgi:hypothetical protein
VAAGSKKLRPDGQTHQEQRVMKRTPLLRNLATTLVLGWIAVAASAGPPRPDAEAIVEWNELLQSVVPAGGLNPPRYYAMLHIAMFDAVNSVERGYGRYRFSVPCAPGASSEAAAAQAGHDILAALFTSPDQVAKFDAALKARLDLINPGRARMGTLVGKSIAKQVLDWRRNDGWSATPPAFALPAFPGVWQPTPPAFQAAQFAQFATTQPFALLTPTQYQPRRPPALDSPEYAEAFNEVKRLGSVSSIERTAEQTQLARLFASVTSSTVHWGLWNHVARDTARAQHLSLIDTARLFALLNVSIHDGVQTSHSSKFVYALWRPISAIRRADEDLNPLTDTDPTWTSLLTTPPYPSHAGNQACVGASAARALALFYGTDAMPFNAVWIGTTGNPDVTRPYAGFWQMATDQANSRVYGGIHFTFENDASREACPRVPEYVFAHYMRPRG